MKGQIFSIDLLLSVTVFLGVMTIGIVTLDDVVQNQQRFNDQQQLRQRATQMADLFVRTPGYPQDWNQSTVEVVGFATRSHVMNTTKFETFDAIGEYEEMKSILQLDPWEFYMDVRSNESVMTVDGQDLSFGQEPGEDAFDVAVNRRSVIIPTTNGTELGTMRVMVWR